MELQRDGPAAVSIGLIGKILAAGGEQFGARGQVESVRMPLIDAARKALGAEVVSRRLRLDGEIADLAALVVVAVHPRSELAREHLGAEADAEQGLPLGQRDREPVDLAPDPLGGIVGAHRAAEDDNPIVVGERLRQRLIETWTADVETRAHGPERQPDPSGGGMLLMQNDQHNRRTSQARHGYTSTLGGRSEYTRNSDYSDATFAPKERRRRLGLERLELTGSRTSGYCRACRVPSGAQNSRE